LIDVFWKKRHSREQYLVLTEINIKLFCDRLGSALSAA